MEPSTSYRLLLIAGGAAIAMLWLLARIRFDEGPVTPNPVPSVLAQLNGGAKYDTLASEIGRSVWAWSATSAPVALLLIAGIAVGPQGINLLSASALPFLNPIVPVALAALGVLVGLGVGDRRSIDHRILAAGALEALSRWSWFPSVWDSWNRRR